MPAMANGNNIVIKALALWTMSLDKWKIASRESQYASPNCPATCMENIAKSPKKILARGRPSPLSGNARILGAYGRFGEGRLP